MKKIIISLGFSLVIIITTFAQEVTVKADRRARTQHARIHHRRKSGEITNREATVLNHEQRHIRRSGRRAKAEGTVTATEKSRLRHKQSRASRHINRAKSNPIDNN
jgi:hypothetical protein